ncbi:uncharacterized protein PODANS_4_9130, partial [Podospora anserina S mat+]
AILHALVRQLPIRPPRSIGRPLRPLLQLRLGLAEESQLPKVERHGTHHRRSRTGPKSTNALALRNRSEGINHRLVILPFGHRLQPITLHADQRQIGRVAQHGSQTTGRQTSSGTLRKANLLSVRLGPGRQAAHKGVEKPNAGGRVHGLSEQTGREPGIQIERLSAGQDVASHRDGRRLRSTSHTLARKLDAHLDHVDGLNHRRGNHPAEAAIDKRKRRPDEGRVEEIAGGGEVVVLH